MTKPNLVTKTSFDKRLLESFDSHHPLIAEHCTILPFIKSKKTDTDAEKREKETFNAFLTYLHLIIQINQLNPRVKLNKVNAKSTFISANNLQIFFNKQYSSVINQLAKDKVIRVTITDTVNEQYVKVNNNKSTFITLLVETPPSTKRHLPVYASNLKKLIRVFKDKFSDKKVFQRFEASKHFNYSKVLVADKRQFVKIFKARVPVDTWLNEQLKKDESPRTLKRYKQLIDFTFNAVNKWNSLPESYRLFTFHIDNYAGRTYSPLNQLKSFTRDYLLNSTNPTETLQSFDFAQSQMTILAHEILKFIGPNYFTKHVNLDSRKIYEVYMEQNPNSSKKNAKAALMTMVFGNKHVPMHFFDQFNNHHQNIGAFIKQLKTNDGFNKFPTLDIKEKCLSNPKIKQSHLAYRLQKIEAVCMDYIIDFAKSKIPDFQYVIVHDGLIFAESDTQTVLDGLRFMNLEMLNQCKMKFSLELVCAQKQAHVMYLTDTEVLAAKWRTLNNVGNANDFSLESRYEDRYIISSVGQIRSRSTGRYLNPTINKNGYLTVNLKNEFGEYNGFLLHRLVAANFCTGECEECQVVNHVDEIKSHPHAANLEWVSQKQNVRHSIKERFQWIGFVDKTIKIQPYKLAKKHNLDVNELLRVIKYPNAKYKQFYHVKKRPNSYSLKNIFSGEVRSFKTKKQIATELNLLDTEVHILTRNHTKAYNGWFRLLDPVFEDEKPIDISTITDKPSGFGTRTPKKTIEDTFLTI